jgi:hypothetical protein
MVGLLQITDTGGFLLEFIGQFVFRHIDPQYSLVYIRLF